MVLQHIDRDRTPRLGTSDADFLHLDPTRRNALAAVAAAVEQGAKTALCTGSAGAGKTTLLNGLARDLAGRGVAVGNDGRRFQCQASTSIDDISGVIQATGAFRVRSKTGEAEAAAPRGAPERHALLLDDVDQLAPEILDRIWQWWRDVEVPANALTLVMTAAKRRSNAFQPSVFEGVASGADVVVDLSPMSRSETEIFVTRYLQAVGYPGLEVFTPAAFDQFAFYGRGTPGRIVQLAPAVLALAEQRGVKTITSELVKQAAHEVFLPQRLKDLARSVGHSEQEADARLNVAAPSLRIPTAREDEQRVPDLTAGRVGKSDAGGGLEPELKPEPEPKPRPEPEAHVGVVAAAAEQAPASRRASYSKILLALTLVAFVLGVGVGVTGSFFRDKDVEMATAAGVEAPARVGTVPPDVAPRDVTSAASEATDSAQRARAERLARAERTVEEILRNRAVTSLPVTSEPVTSPEAPPGTVSPSSADTPAGTGSVSTDAPDGVTVDLAPPADGDIEPATRADAGAAGDAGTAGNAVVADVTDAGAGSRPQAAAVAETVGSETADSQADTRRVGGSVAGPSEAERDGTEQAPPLDADGSLPIDEPPASMAIAAGEAPVAGAADAAPELPGAPPREVSVEEPADAATDVVESLSSAQSATNDLDAAEPASEPASKPEGGTQAEAATAPTVPAAEAEPTAPATAMNGEPSAPQAAGDRPDPVTGGAADIELGDLPPPMSGAPSAASERAPALPPVASPPVAALPAETSATPEPEPEVATRPVAAPPPESTAAPEPEPQPQPQPELGTRPADALDPSGRAAAELPEVGPAGAAADQTETTEAVPDTRLDPARSPVLGDARTPQDTSVPEEDAVRPVVPDAAEPQGSPEAVVAALPPADEPVEPPAPEVFVFDESVQTAQLLLNRLGYRAGPADGYFGRRTEAAIRAFEQAQGLPESGRVTDRLIAALEQQSGTSPGAERRAAPNRSSAAGLDPAGTRDNGPATGDDTLSVLRECAGQQKDWVYAESLGKYVFCRRFGPGPVR